MQTELTLAEKVKQHSDTLRRGEKTGLAIDYYVRRLTENKGAPRLYIDNERIKSAGFEPGQYYKVEKIKNGIKLSAATEEDLDKLDKDELKNYRKISGKEVRRKGFKTSRITPTIDINSKSMLGMFEGMESVRMIVRQGEIFFLPLASELSKRERFERLVNKQLKNIPLAIGSLSHGGGVLSNAVHRGLEKAGVPAKLAFANEIYAPYIEHSSENNPSWDDKTIMLAAPMQELIQDQWMMDLLPKVEILEMGLPCSGASSAGRAKNKNPNMEDHPHVGHLAHSALTIIAKTQPVAIILENVTNYSRTASRSIIVNQLADMGYSTHEVTMYGPDYGANEKRTRWAMVAVTAGVDLSLENLIPEGVILKQISEQLDPSIGLDDPRWKDFASMKVKEARDIAAGKGFRIAKSEMTDCLVDVMTKGYSKIRATDGRVVHPENPELMRQFTAEEHARLAGVDPQLISDLAESVAHEVLGQGVNQQPFEVLAQRVGQALRLLTSEVLECGGIEEVRKIKLSNFQSKKTMELDREDTEEVSFRDLQTERPSAEKPVAEGAPEDSPENTNQMGLGF